MATRAIAKRSRTGLFGRPRTCFVDERPVLAYGLVPDAILVFQEASRCPRPEPLDAPEPFQFRSLQVEVVRALTPVVVARTAHVEASEFDVWTEPFSLPAVHRRWMRRLPQTPLMAACVTLTVLSATSLATELDKVPTAAQSVSHREDLRLPNAAPMEPRGSLVGFADLLRAAWSSGGTAAAELVEVATAGGEVVEVEAGFGVVELAVPSDADVWIDGGARGVVQGTSIFTLSAGDHFIDVRSEGRIESKDIDVADGESIHLSFGAVDR